MQVASNWRGPTGLAGFQWRAACAALLASWACMGCGSTPFPMVKVSGKVTYDDGSVIPAQRIVLSFQSEAPPKDAKTFPRPGRAEVNVADGTFTSVTSKDPGDGLAAGRHKVTISVYDETGAQSRTLIGPEFTDRATTPLVIDTSTRVLELKVKKP